jgi:hypothetical protein
MGFSELVLPALPIVASGSSSLLPTPNTMDSIAARAADEVAARCRGNGDNGGSPRNLRETVANRLLATPTASVAKGGAPQDSKGKRDLRLDVEKLLPTPGVTDSKGATVLEGRERAGRPRTSGDMDLPLAVSRLLKTPTAQLASNGGSQHPDKRRSGGHGPTLADEVEHLLPTPTAMLNAPAPWQPGVQWWLQPRAARNLEGIVTGNTPRMPPTGETSDPPSGDGKPSSDAPPPAPPSQDAPGSG